MLLRVRAHTQSFPGLLHSNGLPSRRLVTRTMASAADTAGSFISQFQLSSDGAQGPLTGRSLAVKDMYDIAGHKTGFGNPTWLATHSTAQHTAPPVAALLAAGAVVVGKTHMDELAYSLDGQNVHYGTPKNVAAPGRIPGGSSSGSAAAVAAGQAEIGLGSDTGGSIRVPASFCGLYGIRPTHGRVSLDGARPLAPSFDTCGWFAKDAVLLQQVGSVLLPETSSSVPSDSKPRWLVAKDAFALAQPATTAAIYGALSGAHFAAVTGILGTPTELEVGGSEVVAAGAGKFEDWWDTFRVCQAYEAWRTHGDWVAQQQPELGPAVAARFKMASSVTAEEFMAADSRRQRIKQHLLSLLGSDGFLTLPTTPGPALPLNAEASVMNEWRQLALSLTCIAGLAGLPQVTLPVAKVDGCPIGLSFMGPPGSDEQLLQLAVSLADALKE